MRIYAFGLVCESLDMKDEKPRSLLEEEYRQAESNWFDACEALQRALEALCGAEDELLTPSHPESTTLH
jgi:hypothetical protein